MLCTVGCTPRVSGARQGWLREASPPNTGALVGLRVVRAALTRLCVPTEEPRLAACGVCATWRHSGSLAGIAGLLSKAVLAVTVEICWCI